MSWAKQADRYRKQTITEDSKCEWCGSKENLTIEHIIPRSILLKMGYEPMETWELTKNLTIVCKVCNKEKGNSICLKMAQTHEALKEILEKNKPTIIWIN
jgi:5-methylcytosine-specific restriction endonuclease McrA